jgi:acetolactate synthase-1/2/3 large subunit
LIESSHYYGKLAEAFRAEGVDTVFTLMGDGNMHWSTAMSAIAKAKMIYTRHEHCACAMAIGYYSATGKPGIASVTCGPGFTQITTALTSAAQAHVPLIVFAGESPLGQMWHNQALEQAPFATAAGAKYIRAHSPKLFLDYVREAFYVARSERMPVVLGVPYDLQCQPAEETAAYLPSTHFLPRVGPTPPNETDVDALVQRLAAAKRPIILCGRGVVASAAQRQIEELAERAGALLATTLPGRGMFDAVHYSIGVAGGFSTELARELFLQSDFILAIGTSLSHHTLDNGRLCPRAHVAHVDEHPCGLRAGLKIADSFVKADAKLAAEMMLTKLRNRQDSETKFRSSEVQDRIVSAVPDSAVFPIAPGTLDPRLVVEMLDRVIPKDWDIVSGSGHSSYFYTHMKHRRPEKFHVIREFGAIGNGISIAIGVAATRDDGKTVLIEGDGSLIMHIQELETVKRQNIKLLICVLNDGAYGAEIHKLRAEGVDERGVVFGRTDFASISQGFGLRGATIDVLNELEARFTDYHAQPEAEIWNFPISDAVISPRMRKHTSKTH